MEDLKNIIRDIPDFPKKGIIFKDITTLLSDAKSYQRASAGRSLQAQMRYSSKPLSKIMRGCFSMSPSCHLPAKPVR